MFRAKHPQVPKDARRRPRTVESGVDRVLPHLESEAITDKPRDDIRTPSPAVNENGASREGTEDLLDRSLLEPDAGAADQDLHPLLLHRCS